MNLRSPSPRALDGVPTLARLGHVGLGAPAGCWRTPWGVRAYADYAGCGDMAFLATYSDDPALNLRAEPQLNGQRRGGFTPRR